MINEYTWIWRVWISLVNHSNYWVFICIVHVSLEGQRISEKCNLIHGFQKVQAGVTGPGGGSIRNKPTNLYFLQFSLPSSHLYSQPICFIIISLQTFFLLWLSGFMANNENVTASEFINPVIKSSVRIYGISESQFQILTKETIPMAHFGFIGKPESKYVWLFRVVVVVVALHAINRAELGIFDLYLT